MPRPALYGFAFALQCVLAATFTHPWDTWVFQTSAREFLLHGITPYAAAQDGPTYMWTGIGQDSLQQWYAYPPLALLLMSATYAAAALGWITTDPLGRLLVKLPFLLGNLLLAYLAYRMIRTAAGENVEANARRAERLLLFSPLLILVATLWGMFEALMAALLLASVLVLRNRRLVTGGALFGAATLLKIFPLYLGPLLLVHLWRRYGPRAAATYFVTGAAVFLAVSLPFAISAPRGFLQQTLLMHVDRPLGSYTAPGILHNLTQRSHALPWLTDQGLAAAFGTFGLLAGALALLLTAAASLLRPPTERDLLFFTGCSFAWALFFNRLLNEQYLVLPLAFFAVWLLHPQRDPALQPARLSPLVWSLSWVGGALALLDDANFIRFIPRDIAAPLWGSDYRVLLVEWGRAIGGESTPWDVERALIRASLGLVLAIYFTGRVLVRPSLAAPLAAAAKRWRPASRPKVAAVAAVFALLLLPSLSLGAGVETPPDEPQLPPPANDRIVGVVYRLDLENPYFDPTRRYGAWEQSPMTPLEGFYDLSTHRMEEHLRMLHGAGFDYVLGTDPPSFRGAARSLALAARATDLPFTLLFDIATLPLDAQRATGFSAASADGLARLLEGPFARFWDEPALLRLGPDARTALFLAGADHVQPAFDQAEREAAAYERWKLEPPAPDAKWDDALRAAWTSRAPRSGEELVQHDDAKWREAYDRLERDFWRRALEGRAANHPIRLFIDDDRPATFWETLDPALDVAAGQQIISPKELDEALAENADASQALASLGVDADDVVPLVVAFDPPDLEPHAFRHPLARQGRLLLDEEWSSILTNRTTTHVLVHAWNGFDNGSALEPTLEAGRVPLDRCAAWIRAYHDGNDTAPRWDPATDPLPPPREDLASWGYPTRDLVG